jgi:Nif-specific regulatory protein
MTLTVPPLRERPAEIQELAALFIARACADGGRADVPSLSPEAHEILLRHTWPGNVRELRNAMDRAVVLCSGPTLLPEHLPPKLIAAPPHAAAKTATLREHVDAAEQQRILAALERRDGNQTRAAAELGISRRTLDARLSEWGLTHSRRRPG